MKTIRLLFLALFAVLWIASPVHGAPEESRRKGDWSALHGLEVGTRVVVVLKDETEFWGKLKEVSDDLIQVEVLGSEVRWAERGKVARVEISEKDRYEFAGETIVGVLFGGLTGFLAGSRIARWIGKSDGGLEDTAAMVTGVVLSGVGMALGSRFGGALFWLDRPVVVYQANDGD